MNIVLVSWTMKTQSVMAGEYSRPLPAVWAHDRRELGITPEEMAFRLEDLAVGGERIHPSWIRAPPRVVQADKGIPASGAISMTLQIFPGVHLAELPARG